MPSSSGAASAAPPLPGAHGGYVSPDLCASGVGPGIGPAVAPARSLGAVYQVFGFDVASKLLLGLATILLIRYMPEREYAAYTLALSLVSLVSQGYIQAFNRIYIVGHEQLGLAPSDLGFLRVQLLGIAVVGLLAAPFARGMGLTYATAAILALATCLSEYAKTHFQRDLRFMRFSMIELSRSTIFLCGVVLLVAIAGMRMRASEALLVQAVAMCLVFQAAFRGVERSRGTSPGRTLSIARALVAGEERYLLGYFVALAVLGQVDVFMLKTMSGVTELATFGAAFRYYTLLSLALGAVNTVLLPAIHHARGTGTLADLIRHQQRLLALFVPVVLAGAWLAGWGIPLIDGGRYPDAVPVFRVLCISAIVSFAFSPYANLVISARAYRFLLAMVVASLAVSIGANMLLVPRYGAIGAAAGTLLAFALLNGSCVLRARWLLRVDVNRSPA